MKLTNLRNIILNESSLISRKKINPINNIEYINSVVKGIIGYIDYNYNYIEENYNTPEAFELRDNGTTLFINSEKILSGSNIGWVQLMVDIEKLFINNPVFGNKIKKLLIGYVGDEHNGMFFKIRTRPNSYNNLQKINYITIEYERNGVNKFTLLNEFYFGNNVKLINIGCIFDKDSPKNFNYQTTDPNSFVMTAGILTNISRHIPRSKIDSINSKKYGNKFLSIFNDSETFKSFLTSNKNLKLINFGIPFTTKINTDYIIVRVKDGSMENQIKTNYLHYYKKMDVFKYDGENQKENDKIESKFGYFLYFTGPKF